MTSRNTNIRYLCFVFYQQTFYMFLCLFQWRINAAAQTLDPQLDKVQQNLKAKNEGGPHENFPQGKPEGRERPLSAGNATAWWRIILAWLFIGFFFFFPFLNICSAGRWHSSLKILLGCLDIEMRQLKQQESEVQGSSLTFTFKKMETVQWSKRARSWIFSSSLASFSQIHSSSFLIRACVRARAREVQPVITRVCCWKDLLQVFITEMIKELLQENPVVFVGHSGTFQETGRKTPSSTIYPIMIPVICYWNDAPMFRWAALVVLNLWH